MTRQQQIAAGKLWTVYADNPIDTVEFEGRSRTSCLNYIKSKYGLRAYRAGQIRIGQVIWEPETEQV